MKLGHIGIPVKDLSRSKAFYDAIISSIDLEFLNQTESSVRYGSNGSVDLYVHTRRAAVTGVHICFEVDKHAQVDTFHANGIAAGEVDHGAPGIRVNYSPTYYAAFLLDPDQNNIEVVCRKK